jgi:hypothetical protein
VPHGVPVQHVPDTQLCPAWQHALEPHGVVPNAQQPPPGSGRPLQHWLTEQIWLCAQHWPLHTTPARGRRLAEGAGV